MHDSLHIDARAARDEVTAGVLRGARLLERLLAVPSTDRDDWVDVLLGLPELPEDEPNLPVGSVPYLPAPVEDILTLVQDAPLRAEDVLVDLGSGAGRVLMLAHLLSGARARGVELQRHLVDTAQRCAAELRLDGVSFACGNAADAALEGSLFFLYSPFNGATLSRVLQRLREVARQRPIVICTVGLELPNEPWLKRRASTSASLTLYDSDLTASAGSPTRRGPADPAP